MKRLMKKDELEGILGDLQFKQANLKMSLSEEKQIIKEISDLKDSLPFAAPLEDLEKQRVPLKKEKDVLAGKMKVLWEQIQVISKEIEEMSTDYDQIKRTQNESFDSMDPAITNKKTDTETKVEQIRATKKRLIKEYRDKLNAYDEQQRQIKRLEWMNNAKQRLIKQKAYLEEEEKKRIQQEEDRKELNDNVYSEEIRLCEFLIRYCK